MKLAFICTEKLPCPAIKGGAIQILIDGVSPILKAKHELTILSVRDPKLPNRETRDGIRYIRLPENNYVERVAKELTKHHFDVIHVFNRPKPVPLYKKAAPKSKFIVSLHNEMFHKEKVTLQEGRKTIQSVEKIITVSDYIGSTVTKRFPEAKNKVKTVYSGADIHAYLPVASPKARKISERIRKKYGVTNKKVILFVGRLSEKKGPHVLMKAMKLVNEKHKNAVLVIVGGKWFGDDSIDDYGHYLQKLVKRLKIKVIFTKFVPADKIPELYLMGDIFVCSSQWQEPLARVHYEAMAAGLPIITTNRGGNGEVIKHNYNGLLLDNYKDPKEFANAIDYLLMNPKQGARMAKNGIEFINKNFRFDHVARRLEDVYLEACGRGTK